MVRSSLCPRVGIAFPCRATSGDHRSASDSTFTWTYFSVLGLGKGQDMRKSRLSEEQIIRVSCPLKAWPIHKTSAMVI